QMTGISGAAIGLIVFNTDYNCFYFHNTSGWEKLISEGSLHTIYDADGMSYLTFMHEPGDTDTLRIFFDDEERYKISSRAIEILNNQGSVFIGQDAGKLSTTAVANIALG
ncbi:hypothetical protein RZS08_54300, partial [Arthrospira platensis SPKY1]|nr:hypothetical protein [Arthrospira platensis SPKY1]